MNIKNIVQIITLASLVATGSAHSMQAIAKAAMRWTGTAIGVGLPTIPFIASTGMELYYATKNPITTSEKVRIPSPEEEAFLRKTITDENIAIRINCDPETSGTILNKVIYIEEVTFASDLTLQQAITSNTPEALEAQKVFRALAEHELYHAQKNHGLLKSAATALIPCITTAIAITCAQKLFPFNNNASVLSYCGRFGAKVAGGALLAAINIAIGLYAEKSISHYQEYAADQNIAAENRDAFILHLKNGQKKRQESIDAIQDATFKSLSKTVSGLGHPPVEERIKRLQAKERPAALKSP